MIVEYSVEYNVNWEREYIARFFSNGWNKDG